MLSWADAVSCGLSISVALLTSSCCIALALRAWVRVSFKVGLSAIR